MRLFKRSLRARVTGFLPIGWTDEALSVHGGLELLPLYLVSYGWLGRLREVFGVRRFNTDYGSWRMALAMIGLLLVGGTRVAHLGQGDDGPPSERLLRRSCAPTEPPMTIVHSDTMLPCSH